MKFWKYTLISAAAFIGLSTTVLYSSCVKDSCERLRCKNGAVCNDEICQCPTGYEGTECEMLWAQRYEGIYDGNTKCNDFAPNIDSAYVTRLQPNKISLRIFSMGVDSNTYTITIDDKSGRYTDASKGIVVDVIDDADRITIREERNDNGSITACTFIGSKRK